MLTPRFSLDQTDEFLILTVYAPFTNIANTEIFIEELDLRFFSKPYFLRLHLPGPVEENDRAEAKYIADDRSFVIKAPKKNPGERFEGLDMLTTLLMPRGEVRASERAGIQMLHVDSSQDAPGEEDEEDIEWYFDQQMPEDDVEENSEDLVFKRESAGYGFAFREIGVFQRLIEESQEILEIRNPDSLTRAQRRSKRWESEEKAFSDDHYLCDLFQTEEIKHLLEAPSLWRQILENENRDEAIDSRINFTKEEQEQFLSLPRKDVLIEKYQRNSIFLGLVDILFAYCYDKRVTEKESSSESGWTIGKLCSTMSCCEKFDTLKECIVACLRRSLCYPLYRHYELARKVLHDVRDLFEVGRVAIIKSLFEILPLMRESDGRYIFNQLYIEPYSIWIQKVNPKHFVSLVKAIDETMLGVDKDDLDLDLQAIEHAAVLVMEEEKAQRELTAVTASLNQVSLNQENDELDSDDSSSDSDEESSSASSDESSSEESGNDKEIK